MKNYDFTNDETKNINDRNLRLHVYDLKKLNVPENVQITDAWYSFNELDYTLSNRQKIIKKSDGSLDLKTIHTETAEELDKKALAKKIEQYYDKAIKKVKNTQLIIKSRLIRQLNFIKKQISI